MYWYVYIICIYLLYYISTKVYAFQMQHHHVNHMSSSKNDNLCRNRKAGPEVLDLHCNPHASPASLKENVLTVSSFDFILLGSNTSNMSYINIILLINLNILIVSCNNIIGSNLQISANPWEKLMVLGRENFSPRVFSKTMCSCCWKKLKQISLHHFVWYGAKLQRIISYILVWWLHLYILWCCEHQLYFRSRRGEVCKISSDVNYSSNIYSCNFPLKSCNTSWDQPLCIYIYIYSTSYLFHPKILCSHISTSSRKRRSNFQDQNLPRNSTSQGLLRCSTLAMYPQQGKSRGGKGVKTRYQWIHILEMSCGPTQPIWTTWNNS